jgi:hypothetical protein
MSLRKFKDTGGGLWQVKVRSRHEWLFEPLPGNPETARTVEPPLYAEDPFELSEQELQRILAGTGEGPARPDRPSPFKNDEEYPKKDRPSLFRD